MPGQAFGPCATAFIEQHILPFFGVSIEHVWAHLVFYPTPDCQLGWHGDSEDGLNTHTVISLTMLEFPVEGIRPFDVRLLSKKLSNKKQKVKSIENIH